MIESLLRVQDIGGTEILSLPLAYSLATLLNGIVLWCSFEIQFKNFSRTLWKPLFDSFSASLSTMSSTSKNYMVYFSKDFVLDC
jgi:hypothetical protein